MRTDKQKILVGNAVVWLILAVSGAATLAYWYVLSGVATSDNMDALWQMLLWLIMFVGAATELLKKVTLSIFRNAPIWFAATCVSVLTVMGTYAIMDQTRQQALDDKSANHKIFVESQRRARETLDKYAYASGYDMDKLTAQYDAVVDKRDRQKLRYNSYLKQTKRLEKKMEARRLYLAARNTLDGKDTDTASATGALNSNPLLATLSGATGFSTAFLVTGFYLFVQLLLEVGAFWIGGRVEELKEGLFALKAELLDAQNKLMFGVSIADLAPNVYASVTHQQANAKLAQAEIDDIRSGRHKKREAGAPQAGDVITEIKELQEMTKEAPKAVKKAPPPPPPPPKPTPKPAPQRRQAPRAPEPPVPDMRKSAGKTDTLLAMNTRFKVASVARNGDLVVCPVCEDHFLKHHNKAYCSNRTSPREDGKNCKSIHRNAMKG